MESVCKDAIRAAKTKGNSIHDCTLRARLLANRPAGDTASLSPGACFAGHPTTCGALDTNAMCWYAPLMVSTNRRQFLAAAAAAAVSLKTYAQNAPYHTVVRLYPEKALHTVPRDFVGLSYEMRQIADPACFSPHNKQLIEQLRTLAPQGVLRLGGNTSDSSYWQPTADSPMPQRRPAFPYGNSPVVDNPFPIRLEDIARLRGFLDAAGWTCIYGINLATNVPPVAVEEAVAVTRILGPRLAFIQIGNEADRYAINRRRDPKTWGPEAYFKEWLTFAHPIAARIPHVRLGLPDLAAKPDWFAAVADNLMNSPLRQHIVSLSYHYYIDGPPSNPAMNIHNMLRANAGVIDGARIVSGAAAKLHTEWRMTEGNTCYSGGKPGVSDVFASALWSADYLLLLASLGCAGVNLHGGNGKAVASSISGKLPGDALLLAEHGDFDKHPHPYYTPIAYIGDSYVAEPVSYGMRFAGQFAGARMIAIDFKPGPVNATAYAGIFPTGRKIVAIVNKDSTQAVKFDLPGYRPELTLAAPSLDASSAELTRPITHGKTGIVPAASAMLFSEP